MQKLLLKSLICTFLFFSVIFFANVQVNAQEDISTSQMQEIVTPENTQPDQLKAGEEQKQEEIDKLNEEMGLGEQKNIVVEDIKTSPNDNMALTKKVVPDTRSELTKMVKMFLRVMFAVALSSVVIFLILLIVRRFYSPKVTLNDLNSNEGEKETLDTPQNKSEALKTFLDKTKGA